MVGSTGSPPRAEPTRTHHLSPQGFLGSSSPDAPLTGIAAPQRPGWHPQYLKASGKAFQSWVSGEADSPPFQVSLPAQAQAGRSTGPAGVIGFSVGSQPLQPPLCCRETMRTRIINPPGAGLGLALENPLNRRQCGCAGGGWGEGRGRCFPRCLHQTPGLTLLGFNKGPLASWLGSILRQGPLCPGCGGSSSSQSHR